MPDHRFLMTRDGVRIAYEVRGNGPTLVYVRGWLSHLDLLWERPGYRAFMQTLAKHFRVVRYDMRGNGLSDREGMRISQTAMVNDLEDLVAHLGLDRFTLWAASFGGPTAICYAAQHPQQVEKLILDSTYARGTQITQRTRRLLLVLALRFFPEMGFLLLSNATHPNPRRSAQRTLELGSQMVSPRVGSRLYRLAFSTDVLRFLAEVKVPTLVLHAMRSRSIPARLGQELSARLPNASFFPLDSDQQNSWEGDLAELFEAVGPFLGVDLAKEERATATAALLRDQSIPEGPFVFVCYAHSNEDKVRPAVDNLVENKLEVWIDAGITPGALWREQIARAVQACGAFLLFASEDSLRSSHCLREIHFAVDENKPILVVYLDNVELGPSLRLSLSTRQAIYRSRLSDEQFFPLLRDGVESLMGAAR